MPINAASLAKVHEAKMKGESFAKVLKTLEATLAVTGAAETNMTFDYQHDDTKVIPGDLIPFITIGLRQATIKLPVIDFDGVAEPKEEQKSDLPG